MNKVLKKYLSILLTCLATLTIAAQENPDFISPVKIPIILSGNFGELRGDHFHSGIDIKTRGTTGHHILSVEDGYVSRLKVQTGGYGLSIYIAHPNGFTSVYGHLSAYRDDIAAYVEQAQYSKESQTVNLYPPKSKFRVKQGDFIAYSGNTGSSAGPHLHFELRQSSGQYPQNALKYIKNVPDNKAPVFFSLQLTPMTTGSHVGFSASKTSRDLERSGVHYGLKNDEKIEVSGDIAIGVEINDFLDGATNRCGVYTLKMYVDNSLVYSQTMESFSFSESRYINAHIDYGEKKRSKRSYQNLYRLASNPLSIYDPGLSNRPPRFDEDRAYQLRILATDVAGNESELEFTLQGSSQRIQPLPQPDNFIEKMKWDSKNYFESGKLDIEIPAGALYRDLDFCYEKTGRANGSTGEFHHLASEEIPLHKKITLRLAYLPLPGENTGNLVFVTFDEDGEADAVPAIYKEGKLEASIGKFGAYALYRDTIVPEIASNLPADHDISALKHLHFTITDELSGIAEYRAYIDNQWVLFNYDPKNSRLSFRLDEKRIERNKLHELELYLTDNSGNTTLLHTTFYW